MDKFVQESIETLRKVLSAADIYFCSKSELKMALSDERDSLHAVWRALFDCLCFLRHGRAEAALFSRLTEECGFEALCAFLSVEVRLQGLPYSEAELQSVRGAVEAVVYLVGERVLERVTRETIWEAREIIISIPSAFQKVVVCEDVQRFNEYEVNDWALLIQESQSLYKQVKVLSDMVGKKYERLKQCKVKPEILYLMKHEALSSHYVTLLRKSNERLKDLVDWFGCEAVFWNWLDKSFSTFEDNEDDKVVNLEVPIMQERDERLERCKTKLFQLESLSNVIDSLWCDTSQKTDMSMVEVLGELNAKVFIDNKIVGVQGVPHKCSETDPFKSTNCKLSQNIELFNIKYERKMKKLSKYVHGSILDGSS